MNPQTYYNPNANYFSNPSATSPEKAKFIASASSQSYKGPSIVDYLAKSGQPTDLASRTALGAKYGISDIGSASGNTALLNALRGGTAPAENATNNVTDPNSTNTSNVPAPEDPFSAYLKSLEQSTEITEATKYVNNLITQGKQDQETALNRGETLGFATGEAARVGRQNALTLEAASRGLDALVASNASKKEIAKARYDYEKAKIEAAKADKKTGFELSPGQKRYEFDPKTGAYKEVASVAPAPKDTSKADQKAQLSTDVNEAVDQLGKIVKAKGFRGVSPDDYNTMRAYLQDTYGVDGVIELDKAMKALGLVVDDDWAKLDAKNK